jgi:BirA family biotin operon repressor/biotin-[acetyl-CoA-carboxylase] ligase
MVDVLVAFDRQLADLDRPDGPERLRRDHLAVSATVGSRVRVERPSGALVGDAVDLTLQSALVVAPDGTGPTAEPVEVHAGDVTHLRVVP